MSDWVYSHLGSEIKEKVKIMCTVKGITQTKFVKEAVVDKLNKELNYDDIDIYIGNMKGMMKNSFGHIVLDGNENNSILGKQVSIGEMVNEYNI